MKEVWRTFYELYMETNKTSMIFKPMEDAGNMFKGKYENEARGEAKDRLIKKGNFLRIWNVLIQEKCL